MVRKISVNNKNEVLPLAEAFNSFNNIISDLDLSYKDLKGSIEELNLKISEKNKFLEKNFFEVNRVRCFFDSILNSMRDGVIVVDMKGRIVLLNKSIKKMTGYSDYEVIGESYKKIFGKTVSERFSPIYTLSHNIPLVMEEKELTTKSGKKIPVRYSTSIVYDSEDEVIGVVEVSSDLTRIKRLEVQMQKIKTQAALNQMAGLVAHEIRNPLAGIKGYIDLLKESFDKSDKKQEKINEIYSLIKKLNKIVVNFMIMAQPIKPNFVKTDIIEFIQNVTDYFCSKNNLEEKKITLDISIPEGMDTLLINCDPILMEQTLIMILDNAVKAMDIGGNLGIKLKTEHIQERRKREIAIIISDSGCGMSKDVKNKIFNPFFTTRDKGMGLGLSLARNFIKFHDGNIFVESEEGIGTTVNIILPKSYEV